MLGPEPFDPWFVAAVPAAAAVVEEASSFEAVVPVAEEAGLPAMEPDDPELEVTEDALADAEAASTVVSDGSEDGPGEDLDGGSEDGPDGAGDGAAFVLRGGAGVSLGWSGVGWKFAGLVVATIATSGAPSVRTVVAQLR